MSDSVRMIFSQPEQLHRAVRELLEAGIDRSRIDVVSDEPFLLNGEPAAGSSRSQIGIFSLAGAGIGALAGWSLVYFTSHAYPIATGGMPLVPAFTTGIIMYETAAVGAILFALGRFLREARLPGRLYVPDDETDLMGGALLCVEGEDSERVREILSGSGGRLINSREDGESGRTDVPATAL
jgi:hypothetical protein